MKIYLILAQASYDDAFGICSIFSHKEDAEKELIKLQENEKSTYVHHWIEEEELK